MNNKSLNLNLKLTINQMLMSNVHVGHTRRFLNVKVKPYLLGYRNKQKDDTHFLLYNRERVSNKIMYEDLPWYKIKKRHP